MRMVADSNILFSALISGKELWIDIFRSSEIYVPDFIFAELSKYQEKIIRKDETGRGVHIFCKGSVFCDNSGSRTGGVAGKPRKSACVV